MVLEMEVGKEDGDGDVYCRGEGEGTRLGGAWATAAWRSQPRRWHGGALQWLLWVVAMRRRREGELCVVREGVVQRCVMDCKGGSGFNGVRQHTEMEGQGHGGLLV